MEIPLLITSSMTRQVSPALNTPSTIFLVPCPLASLRLMTRGLSRRIDIVELSERAA